MDNLDISALLCELETVSSTGEYPALTLLRDGLRDHLAQGLDPGFLGSLFVFQVCKHLLADCHCLTLL